MLSHLSVSLSVLVLTGGLFSYKKKLIVHCHSFSIFCQTLPSQPPSALSLQFVPICLQCRRALAAPLNSSPHFLGTLVTAHYIDTLLGHTCTKDVEHNNTQVHTRHCMILHTSSTHYWRTLAPTTLQTSANHIETLLHISVHQHRMILHTHLTTLPHHTLNSYVRSCILVNSA